MSLILIICSIAAFAIVASWLVARCVGWGTVAMFWMFYILFMLAIVGAWIDSQLPE